jgi:polyhydroxyalkanoate synthesis regulator phasin
MELTLIEILLGALGSFIGGGALLQIIMHFLNKKKNEAEVVNQNVNNESIVQETYSKVLLDLKELLREEREDCEKKISRLEKMLEEEALKRREDKKLSDDKIKTLKEELERLRKQSDKLKNIIKESSMSCLGQCFNKEFGDI